MEPKAVTIPNIAAVAEAMEEVEEVMVVEEAAVAVEEPLVTGHGQEGSHCSLWTQGQGNKALNGGSQSRRRPLLIESAYYRLYI